MQQSKVVLGVVVLLAFLAGVEGLLYNQIQEDYNILSKKYNTIEELYSNLQSNYSSLYDSYQSLHDMHNALQTLYDSLSVNYTSLRDSYYALLDDYYALQDDFYTLRDDYHALLGDYEIERALRIGNSLASYYDLVRAESGPKPWWTTPQMTQFAAMLALHSLGRNCWPTHENEFYRIVGAHSYDIAWTLLATVLDLTGTNISQTTTTRIRNILYFINQHIHYEYEMDNIFLAPSEIIGFKSGDCDDFTVLAAALFEAAGIDSAVALFEHQDPGAEKEYHMMVLVHLDNLGEYEYWYYSDLTSIGLEAGKWIKIEP